MAEKKPGWRQSLAKTFQPKAELPKRIYVGIAAAAFLLRGRFPGFYAKVNSLPVILTVLVLLLLWWVFRNLFGL